MNLAEFAIRQRTFVIFFTILCMIAGGLSYFELGKLEDPSFTVKSAVVVTLYPGASAEEVEHQVTDKVETAFKDNIAPLDAHVIWWNTQHSNFTAMVHLV